jgi:biotin operon repressor
MTKKIKYPKAFLKAIKQLKKEGTIKEVKKDTYRLVEKNQTSLGNVQVGVVRGGKNDNS